MIGNSQVSNLGRTDLGCREVAGVCSFSKSLNFAKIPSSKLCIGQSSISWPSKSLCPLILKASATAQIEAAAVASEKASGNRRSDALSFFF